MTAGREMERGRGRRWVKGMRRYLGGGGGEKKQLPLPHPVLHVGCDGHD